MKEILTLVLVLGLCYYFIHWIVSKVIQDFNEQYGKLEVEK